MITAVYRSRKEDRNATIGDFRFHAGVARRSTVIRNLIMLISFPIKGLWLHYFKNKFDVIVSPDPLLTGIIALLIGKLTGVKVIVEVNGNFESAFKQSSGKPILMDRIKHNITHIIMPFVLNRANAVKLLNKNQIKSYKKLKYPEGYYRFAGFIPLNLFKEGKKDKKYILFLGYPWYLKGVDILIKAFKIISPDFPEYSLKIVGWCPSHKEYFADLARGNNKIELCDPVFYEEAIQLMSECSLFVLPSRSEAMGRVLLEAMASKKPIIASNVGGIPTYIKDGYNGLLFQSENVQDLAEKMRELLSDRVYARKLAENGYHYVHKYLSEECYLEKYYDMVKKTVNS